MKAEGCAVIAGLLVVLGHCSVDPQRLNECSARCVWVVTGVGEREQGAGSAEREALWARLTQRNLRIFISA